MNMKTWASIRVGAIGLAATLLAVAPLHAGEKTDVLYMKNGDRLTCEIKSLDAGALHVSLDYVDGTISVQWSKVERLDSKRLFIVKLEDGSVYTGTLSIAETAPDEPPKLQISSGSRQLRADRQEAHRGDGRDVQGLLATPCRGHLLGDHLQQGQPVDPVQHRLDDHLSPPAVGGSISASTRPCRRARA